VITEASGYRTLAHARGDGSRGVICGPNEGSLAPRMRGRSKAGVEGSEMVKSALPTRG
jgi:hypothetical protein